MKWVKKFGVGSIGILLVAFCMTSMDVNVIFAASEKDDQNHDTMSYLEQEGLFTAMDEDGNVSYIKVTNEDRTKELALPEKKDASTTFDLKRVYDDGETMDIASYDSFEEANAAMMRQSLFRSANSNVAVYTNDRVRSVTNGVVNFRTKSCDVLTYYEEDGTGQRGGINGCYGSDAAYLGTNTDGTKVKFRMAGVTGWVSAADVEILNFDTNDVLSVNYYSITGGRIYHKITIDTTQPYYASSVDVGPMQSYMKEGEYYYSYDGHYFYRTYAQMIADYKSNTYAHAINAGKPYYNYYQYLSFRTKTNITAANFNDLIAKAKGSSSALYNQGSHYITHQNTYGANAALVMGVSINESAWGMSDYALNRNNIFGLNAYDSDPDQASRFASISECIRQFSQTQVSINYLDPNDVSGLYHGSCLGDKSIGMAVKYATAPYWGETNASYVYTLEKNIGKNVDYGKYKIGIKENGTNVNIRKEPNTSSTLLYRTGAWNNYPFLILDTVKGESVNGNTTWYKIATDAPLSSDRTKALQFMPNQGGEYNASVSYAYVSAELLDVVAYGDGQTNPQPDPDPVDPPVTTYKKGDVNGDGYVSSKDYNAVKNHITGYKKLTGDELKRADVNGDGYVSSKDYNAIKNHITGYKPLF